MRAFHVFPLSTQISMCVNCSSVTRFSVRLRKVLGNYNVVCPHWCVRTYGALRALQLRDCCCSSSSSSSEYMPKGLVGWRRGPPNSWILQHALRCACPFHRNSRSSDAYVVLLGTSSLCAMFIVICRCACCLHKCFVLGFYSI